MGQFTSWAMAKSTQTNKLLTRIEDGEAKQMVKLLASLPVYGGIQMLREISKHGEIKTDPSNNEVKWWAEALRLSGMSGILPELAIGRLTGPGSQQPWLIPIPAASVATDLGLIATDSIKGDTDKASRRFWEKVMPFPTYRKLIKDLFSSGTKATIFNDGLDINTGEINIGTSVSARTINLGNDDSTKIDLNANAIELDSEGTIVLASDGSTTITSSTFDIQSVGSLTLEKCNNESDREYIFVFTGRTKDPGV